MSRRTKQRVAGDVTINDFADSTVQSGRGRLKKSTFTSKAIPVGDNEPIVDDDDVQEKRRRSRKGQKLEETEDPDHIYNDYHLDIWYLIGEHILPEDISAFARICHKTLAVTHSAKFWTQLYRKHYQALPCIPMRLQPECMGRLGGLRASTIRSLFFTYTPFVQRLTHISNDLEQDFSPLYKQLCLTAWYTQLSKCWIFCFKLRQRVAPKDTRPPDVVINGEKEDEFAKLRDVFANPENGCQLLVVMTKQFTPLPDFGGQPAFVGAITKKLTKDFLNYKIELKFVNYCGQAVASVTFDPFTSINVLNWWTPEYDHYIGRKWL